MDRIREQWQEIARALTTAVKLVHGWSYSGNNAVSLNAVIAIALIVRRGLDYANSEADLRMFLIRSLICGLYERHAERTLAAIRNYLETIPSGALFSLPDLMQKAEFPSALTLELTAEGIDELLNTQIWHPRTYVLLSLLHGQHALHQHAFEKDHIHPRSKFENLAVLNLGPEREALWHDLKDRLPNLQLLQDGENNHKRAKPFKDWLPIYRPNDQWRKAYLAENDIPEDLSLDFVDFEPFFEKRRESLRARLATLLSVDIPRATQGDITL